MDERLGRDINLRELGCAASEPGDAYLAIPKPESGPGVVVIHEAWGLTDEIRDACDRLARAGFVALAPDLYRGEATREHAAAHRLMHSLEIPRAIDDLGACVEGLLGHDAVTGSRVGCIGFCMGGQLALSAATQIQRIGAVVDCYGVHPDVELDLSGLEASVLGIFAEHDEWVPAETVRDLEASLKSAGKQAHFVTHLGVQHAFMNPARPDVYDAATADEAWSELLTFLRSALA